MDDLFAYYQKKIPQLTLVKLGCPGETLASMISGGNCAYPLGSQLAQAVAFLQAHQVPPERVALITLDIGANDIVPCFSASGIDAACVQAAYRAGATDLPVIVSALRGAAGQNVPLVGMTYYDPFLAAELLGSDQAHNLAEESVSITVTANTILSGVYSSFQVPVADVQGAFQTTNGAFEGGPLPVNVGVICAWTWMCAEQDIHPNVQGYAAIATAFEQVIGPRPVPATAR